MTKSCMWCGKEFEYKPGIWWKLYCSKECRMMAQTFRAFSRRHHDEFYVFLRDGFRCRYCGRTPVDGVKLSIDHVFPLARTHTDAEREKAGSPVNLVTACRECNSQKGATLFDKQMYFQIWQKNLQLAKGQEYRILALWKEFKERYVEEEIPLTVESVLEVVGWQEPKRKRE